MKRRIGLLSISVTALGLAVASFLAQAHSVAPVAVADFDVAPLGLASSETPDEYDSVAQQNDLFHPASAELQIRPCADRNGLTTVALSADVAAVCYEGETVGYLTAIPGQKPQLIVTPALTKECPERVKTDAALPAA